MRPPEEMRTTAFSMKSRGGTRCSVALTVVRMISGFAGVFRRARRASVAMRRAEMSVSGETRS